jgi:hypothetical protein
LIVVFIAAVAIPTATVAVDVVIAAVIIAIAVTAVIVVVSLPMKSTYVQKPTYASLANVSEGEFKSPCGRFSVAKPT